MELRDWERGMKRFEVIQKALSGEIKWVDVAIILGLSARQVRRIKQRLLSEGTRALMDRRIGGAAPNRAPQAQVDKVLELYRNEYFDFSPAHFHEKLLKEHGIKRSYAWVRYTLQNAGLVAKQLPRGPHRMRRERKPMVGMMIHIDGSDHHWLGEEHSKWDLVMTLDDANNEIYSGIFCLEEDTRSVFHVLKETVEKKGIFCSLYSDRASHFFLTEKTGGKVDKKIRTQCQRAMEQLGTRMIPSYSPQARGRMERLWRTIQGRLPQELRLRKITNISEANRYLREIFIPELNQIFKKEPLDKTSAFVPIHPGVNLHRIFSIQTERKVKKDNTVSFKTLNLQIPKNETRHSFADCSVTLYEHLDGTIEIGFGPHTLGMFHPHGELISSKQIPKGKLA